jgi:hypothetical protein
MADKKISELTELTTPDGTEELVVNDSGVSKKITQTNLLSTSLPLAGGTITGTISNFTSTGIDDNATANKLTVADTLITSLTELRLANPSAETLLYLYGASGQKSKIILNEYGVRAWWMGAGINTSGNFSIADGTTERFAVTTAGDIKATTGNLVIGTSGKGIDFSADGNATGMTSEVLDDYEEGTWTPSLGGTATYSRQVGEYVKVGNKVTVSWDIEVTLIGTGHTSIMSGIPFPAKTAINNAATVGYFTNLATSAIALYLRLDGGISNVNNATQESSDATVSSGTSIYGNNTRIIASMTYITT